MQANIYLVFNNAGHMISTRVMYQECCWYRSVNKAEEIASWSKTNIDLGSQEPWSVYTTVMIEDAMHKFDEYVGLISVQVATIDL